MSRPETSAAPDQVFRVARSSGLLTFSAISPADAMLAKAGNRFDVPGGGVLYVGSTVEVCYAETLARFRPTPVMRELLEDEPGFMVVGGVPQDWRLQRVVGTIGLDSPLPFLDAESPATHAYLSEVLFPELVNLGYGENLDFSDLCNKDRRLSRAIANHAYTATDDAGVPLYSGIRYLSRLNPAWECWAIFDGTDVVERSRQAIELGDPDLKKIATMWDLALF